MYRMADGRVSKRGHIIFPPGLVSQAHLKRLAEVVAERTGPEQVTINLHVGVNRPEPAALVGHPSSGRHDLVGFEYGSKSAPTALAPPRMMRRQTTADQFLAKPRAGRIRLRRPRRIPGLLTRHGSAT